MAIQIPNPGTGNGATGDNEFVLWSKVKDNFNDQTNAASRLVGTATGQVLLAEDVQKASYTRVKDYSAFGVSSIGALPVGSVALVKPSYNASDFPVTTGLPEKTEWHTTTIQVGAATANIKQVALTNSFNGANGLATRGLSSGGEWQPWVFYYHTGNTTKDSNGFLKASSPIVKVFADKVELNSDAVNQNVTYKKNGIGDYTITTVSGLSTDGWYIELPKDMNGNPKVAVTLSEVDGVISLKTYKRIFSMETFTFEPDLDSPLDIPDTRWIDLRLNEIPVEFEEDIQTEDIQTEDTDLGK